MNAAINNVIMTVAVIWGVAGGITLALEAVSKWWWHR